MEIEKYTKSEILTSPHGFSKRNGGVSEGEYASLNLGLNRGDDNNAVISNWKIFMDAIDVGYRPFVCGKQVHGSTVHIATKGDAYEPYQAKKEIEADGFVTNIKELPVAVFTADCVPVLMEDLNAGVVGAIHCGWRSTVADIEKNAIEAFETLGAKKEDISIGIGPAIRKCHFEVGKEVIDAARNLIGEDIDGLYDEKINGKFMLDLQAVVRTRFIQLGVNQERITIDSGCTMCNPESYYSHRYTGSARGSLASMIMLV